MLAIRMQRIGRSGHAQYRVIVQDSRFSPKSGRVVAYLGSYNPHTKQASIDSEKTATYLSNGARPSDRVVRLLKAEKVKLPSWVQEPAKKKRETRNPEKLRRNQPAEAAEPKSPSTDAEPQEQAEEAPQAEAEAPAAEADPGGDEAEESSPAAETEAPSES